MITFDSITALLVGYVLGLATAFVGGYIIERKTIGARARRTFSDFERERSRVRRKLEGK